MNSIFICLFINYKIKYEILNILPRSFTSLYQNNDLVFFFFSPKLFHIIWTKKKPTKRQQRLKQKTNVSNVVFKYYSTKVTIIVLKNH